jgi:serine/threonine protein kinase
MDEISVEVWESLCVRFEMLEKVGEGGFGQVWRALDRESGKEVAVKVLSPDAAGPDLVQEIESMQTVVSPYVISYRGSEWAGDRIWVAMEWCELGDLASLMNICEVTLTEQEIHDVLVCVLDGLETIHAQGRVHRDIVRGLLL